MPKQTGAIRIKGKLGDLSFGDKVVRSKGGVSKARMETDPAFETVRNNQAEFAVAAKGSKIIRSAFRLMLKNAADQKLANRLMKMLKAIIKTDAANVRGKRKIENGHLQLLRGFEFNSRGALSAAFFAPVTVTVQRPAGNVLINLAAFVPTDMITPPLSATHFQLVFGVAEIDFSTGVISSYNDAENPLPINAESTAEISFSLPITPNSTHIVVVVVGIQFLEQQANNELRPLKTGAGKSLAIVEVSKA